MPDVDAVNPDSPAPDTVTPGAVDADALNEALRGTMCEATGMRLLELSAESGVMTMPVAGNTQPAGLLHGGASIALAESVASFCAIVRARELHGPSAQAVGTHVSATHHRSAREGTVTARCRALHLGRTLVTYEVQVSDENDRLLSTVSVSAMILAPR